MTNDPAGNKNEGYWNYHGENAVYTWSQVNSSSKWFITVYGTVTPTNKPPAGWLDGANCSDVFGWSQDPDEPSKSIAVHLYFGGPAGSGATGKPLQASQDRSDLCGAIGSCNHAFAMASPYSLYDGKDHPEVWIVDEGYRRHVPSPEIAASWRLDLNAVQVKPLAEVEVYPVAPPSQGQGRLRLFRRRDGARPPRRPARAVRIAETIVDRHILNHLGLDSATRGDI